MTGIDGVDVTYIATSDGRTIEDMLRAANLFMTALIPKQTYFDKFVNLRNPTVLSTNADDSGILTEIAPSLTTDLEPTPELADTPEKPPTQTLHVEGNDFARSGPNSGTIGRLPHNPHFQNYAIEKSGMNPEAVLDSLEFAMDFANLNVAASDGHTRAKKLQAMLDHFAGWKVTNGITD